MSDDKTITNACTGFPNPISLSGDFFFPQAVSCAFRASLKLEETPKDHRVLCIHLATSGARTHFTQLLRGDSSISSCSSKREKPSGRQCWLADLAEANSRGFLLIRGAATGLHSSASSSSQNTWWKQLWTALEGLSEGKGGEVCVFPQGKHALHESNKAELPTPFHTALELILLSKPTAVLFAVFALVQFVPMLLFEYLCWCSHQLPVQY